MSTSLSHPHVDVLDVRVSAVNLDSAERLIFEAIERKHKGYICVTGVHGVSEAQDDPSFLEILNGAFINTPDGMPMTWVGRCYGHEEMDRVYGPDLMLRVFERGVEIGTRHFFCGGGEGVSERLRDRLVARFPQASVCGCYTPPFRPLSEEELADLRKQVADARPDIIWVGLSTPKQEQFMAAHLDQLETCLMIGVGAAFDFHAGLVPQAPRWMQRSSLEWLYRLYREPRRLWKRYLKNNPLFLWRISRQLLGLRRTKQN